MKGLKLSDTNIAYDIVIIGAGANGSHFFRSLLQDLSGFEESVTVKITIADADKVEGKNLKNQLFDKEDIGEFKVEALVDRYSMHYGCFVQSVTSYITDISMIRSLFSLTQKDVRDGVVIMPVLIGCVDNNATRQLMHRFFYEEENIIYVDLGVEGVTLPNPNLTPSERAIEKGIIDATGFTGQVVTGYKRDGEIFLPPVGDVYRNILMEQDRFPGQSCGAAIVNNPQRCATNKLAAQLANGVIVGLFHTKSLYTHVIDFNAQYSGSKPHFIPGPVFKKHFELLKDKRIQNK
ncbi:ThiF family adenylyltransferase [Alkalihalophilus marmarensis]|uniref:ThiF family adenylyltransferase n=1 Tax=Alkalihalophilus marmarensis TaxID=521377 RepID=UPI002DBA0F7E|nr:ThiF family adenylyltransferase [Alkalihalophilus marmarensis]MEC2074219.1 ThiF family adenylyltransferase [Alkalihalophilus marmarensis]